MDFNRMRQRWFKLIMAVPLIVFGGIIAFFGNMATNPFIIVIGMGSVAAGVMAAWSWFQGSTIKVEKEAQALERIANSLIISKDYIKFAHEDKPLGYQSKCRNDGKSYYVMLDFAEEKIPFTLPDEEMVDDPREFANPVTMPCNKKYFSWFKPEFQKVSTIILGVTIIFEIIGLIALGG